MRILWVKAGKLLPVDTGGKIRSFNLLRHLAARHDVTLLTYHDGARDEAYQRAIAQQFPGSVTVNTGGGESTAATALRYLRELPSPAPFAVTKFSAAPVRRLVASALAERRCDVAVCDFLSASLNFPANPQVPCVLFQHNVESVLWARQAREERHTVKRMVYKIEAAKMARYEARTVERFARVIAVSEADRQAMASMTDPERIAVVPTGVDTRRYTPSAQPPRDGLVLFLGSMDWEPNIDGVDYFCREIWPAVQDAVPQARFRVVGRNPAASVRRLASESVEITGTVPSVLEHLHEASVVVVPLRIGGGTRLKIYEAMAAGKAVVSTTIGAEGLDVHHGQNILIADDPGAFAMSVVDLLRDGQARRRMQDAAVALAALNDWQQVSTAFERVLADAAAKPAGRPALDPLGATA